MKKPLFLALLTLLYIHPGYAQTIDQVKLDKYFNVLEAGNKFMGSAAILKDGKIVYTKAIGFKSLADQHKADIHTKYRIGSISKTLTATLILKAVEEKKISLSESISSYFPGIKNANKITLTQLLNHHSGIPNFTNNPDYLNWYTQKKSEQELVKLIAASGSDFEPGTKAAYSNSNYVLLSYILEKIYKMPYGRILNGKIVKPLGLKETLVGSKIASENNESYSYELKDEKWVLQPETDMSIPLGAGALVSTPSDLSVFIYALFNGKLISAESVKKMQTLADGYGLGLVQVPFYEQIGYGHGGGIDGFRSFLVYYPEDKVAVAYTSNGSNYDNNNVTIALLSSVYNKAYEIPDFTSIDKDLDQYPGVYSSTDFPLKITITKSGNGLVAQATGQPSFPLKAGGKDIYTFDVAGIALHFNPGMKQMTLKQGGKEYVLTKE